MGSGPVVWGEFVPEGFDSMQYPALNLAEVPGRCLESRSAEAQRLRCTAQGSKLDMSMSRGQGGGGLLFSLF